MRKTDKKIDNQLRIALTDVCEKTLENIEGFQWLTHRVNYSNFPKSLKIVCVFDTNESLTAFMSEGNREVLTALMSKKLSEVDINIKNIAAHVTYDTEEDCESEHNGNWAERLG